MKLFDWLEFFSDKRFGWRFKFANLIMNDYLRNYLAVGGLMNLDNIIDIGAETVLDLLVIQYANNARKAITDVMEM